MIKIKIVFTVLKNIVGSKNMHLEKRVPSDFFSHPQEKKDNNVSFTAILVLLLMLQL
jgi:hypothetical protein